MNQALDIWSELWQAYYGKNGFGGDTAEIYAYRLMPNIPTLDHQGDTFKNSTKIAYCKAQMSLYNLLDKFERDNDCRIFVDKMALRDWVETDEFNHRCHVKIIHNEMEK